MTPTNLCEALPATDWSPMLYTKTGGADFRVLQFPRAARSGADPEDWIKNTLPQALCRALPGNGPACARGQGRWALVALSQGEWCWEIIATFGPIEQLAGEAQHDQLKPYFTDQVGRTIPAHVGWARRLAAPGAEQGHCVLGEVASALTFAPEHLHALAQAWQQPDGPWHELAWSSAPRDGRPLQWLPRGVPIQALTRHRAALLAAGHREFALRFGLGGEVEPHVYVGPAQSALTFRPPPSPSHRDVSLRERLGVNPDADPRWRAGLEMPDSEGPLHSILRRLAARLEFVVQLLELTPRCPPRQAGHQGSPKRGERNTFHERRR